MALVDPAVIKPPVCALSLALPLEGSLSQVISGHKPRYLHTLETLSERLWSLLEHLISNGIFSAKNIYCCSKSIWGKVMLFSNTAPIKVEYL